MIPTTCGTGSEATCNAIVAIPEEQSKKGIVNAEMIPDYVILDAQMIAGLPASHRSGHRGGRPGSRGGVLYLKKGYSFK